MSSSRSVPSVIQPELLVRLRAILAEVAASGEAMPGEPILAKELGVSRPRLREALVHLERDGLLRRRQGARGEVNGPGLELRSRFDLQVDYAELLESAGMVAHLDVLDHEVVVLDDGDAAILHCPAGSPGLRTVRRWRANGRPAMVTTDVVLLPDETAADGLDPTRTVFQLIEAIWQEPLAWELASPSAVVLDSTTAKLLGRRRGDAALTLSLLGVTGRGRRVFSAMEHHVPEMVTYTFVRSVPHHQ